MASPLLIALGFSSLAFLEALASLRGGLEFKAALERAAAREPLFTPPASLIVPCRGVDPGFEDNLRAFLALDYPDLQFLFVTGEVDDPCVEPIERLLKERPDRCARVLFAGSATRRGQKVHNLLHALHHLRKEDEVVAFGDSDIRPDSNWLRGLSSGLREPTAMAVTGFRWYLPQTDSFGSVLRTVWNAGAVTLLKERDSLFAWGGAMAMRREDLVKCRVQDYWERALSDDLALSRAVQDHGGSIHFQPLALSFSHEDCSLRELLNWSRRQMVILRVCQRRLWWLSCVAQTVNAAGLWGGLAVLWLDRLASNESVRSADGLPWYLLAALVVLVYGLGCAKAWIRFKAVCGLFPGRAMEIGRHRRALTFWTPLASLVSLTALGRSAVSRDVEWRGIRYRMHAADRTEIL